METKTVVEANLESFNLGYFDEGDGDYTEITLSNLAEFSKQLECSEALLEFILDNFELLKDYLLDDLKDIWRKLENS